MLFHFLDLMVLKTLVFVITVVELSAKGPKATDGGFISLIVQSKCALAIWFEIWLPLLDVGLETTLFQIALHSARMKLLSIS